MLIGLSSISHATNKTPYEAGHLASSTAHCTQWLGLICTLMHCNNASACTLRLQSACQPAGCAPTVMLASLLLISTLLGPQLCSSKHAAVEQTLLEEAEELLPWMTHVRRRATPHSCLTLPWMLLQAKYFLCFLE